MVLNKYDTTLRNLSPERAKDGVSASNRVKKGTKRDRNRPKRDKNRLNRAKDSIFDQTLPVFFVEKVAEWGFHPPFRVFFAQKHVVDLGGTPLRKKTTNKKWSKNSGQ